MKTREEIKSKIHANVTEIERLKKENDALAMQEIRISDESQWFEEKEEDVIIKKQPKATVKMLIGRVHWKEDFKDDDTGEIITIERSQVVLVNGEWA